MHKSAPLVSIIVPVYNREALLPICLESLRQQTADLWECIVIDDGSTDNTMAIARSICERDSRLKVISRTEGKKGAAAARNEGLRQASGAYVMFLDSDDVLSPGSIA